MPTVIDKMIRLAGIPPGDRTILNYGLPELSMTWSIPAICEYFKQMIAQESKIDSNGRIVWGRTNALYAGKKTQAYNFKSQISVDAYNFLKTSGQMRELKKAKGYEKIRERYIALGRLADLKNNRHSKESVIAAELIEVIEHNRNRLIDDKTNLLKKLGFSVSVAPRRLSYHKNSERVTVSWSANINSISSKIMVALVMFPRHPTKSLRLKNWLQSRSKDEIDTAIGNLRKRGFTL